MEATWDAVRDQTRNLAACLGDLTREPWEAPSLCSGWRVRDVLAHVTAGAKGAYRPPAIPAGLLRHRLDYNRWIAQDGRARGQEDPAAILAAFRTTAQPSQLERRSSARAALAHVLIHGQDICRPLGIARKLSEAHLIAVSDFTATSIIFRTPRCRAAGLTLTATDASFGGVSVPDMTATGTRGRPWS